MATKKTTWTFTQTILQKNKGYSMANFNAERYYCLLVYDDNFWTLNDGYFSSKESAKKWAAHYKCSADGNYTARLFRKVNGDIERDTWGNGIVCEVWKFKAKFDPNKVTYTIHSKR